MTRSGSQRADRRSGRGKAAEPYPTVTAHAGSLETRPNTRQSITTALKYPVECLEADVRFTPKHEAYLSHDPVAVPLPRNVMRLKELLRLAAPHPKVRLNLDMNEYSGLEEMAALLKRSRMASRAFLTGVEREAVPSVKSSAGGLPYFLNARANFWQRHTDAGAAAFARAVKACGAIGLNSHHLFVTRRLARALAKAGLSLSVWTVDGEREMHRMLELPADNITTNRVDALLALRDGRLR
jgi:glycerophosphoryl diester phosphodiesterase